MPITSISSVNFSGKKYKLPKVSKKNAEVIKKQIQQQNTQSQLNPNNPMVKFINHVNTAYKK